MITRSDVEAAATRIAGRVRRTPIMETDLDGRGTVWLKLEYVQHTGSFKPRGMFNRMLASVEADAMPETGVAAASGGNAGLAVAYAADELGIPVEVFVPENAPTVKMAALQALGAVVVQHGSEYAEAYEAAMKRGAETGALYCHAYDQPLVVAGQGTVGLELDEQTGGVDTVLVAVGGGGLAAGIAAALEGRTRVVGVEPDAAPTLNEALAAGGPVDVSVGGVAVDSLGARRLGAIAYDVAVRCGMGSLLVPDEAIVAARRLLWQRLRIVVEHGAAAPLAALLTGAYSIGPGERVAVLLCGANTDPSDLVSSLQSGDQGRL